MVQPQMAGRGKALYLYITPALTTLLGYVTMTLSGQNPLPMFGGVFCVFQD